jgi:hypothetical protein
MTFDDIRAGADGALHTADDVFLHPIAGAKVYILGLEGHVGSGRHSLAEWIV